MTQAASEESISPFVPSKHWSLFSTGNYPYVCARVRAKRALLLSHDTYMKLLMMDTHEISRFLGESHYKEEITELGLTYTGFELTERALNKNMAEVYQKILSYCDGELSTMLAAYLQKADVWNIKTILRGKAYHASDDEIIRSLQPTGKYPEEYWREVILRSKTVEESIENLKGNEFYEILLTLKDTWMNNPVECENTLERAYYSNLLHSISPSSEANKLFSDFIRREIDLLNLKTLFMTKYERVEPANIIPMLLLGGDIPEKTMQLLINASDFTQFLEESQKLQHYPQIRDLLGTIERTGSLSHVIRALEKEHLTRATKLSYLHPLSILPILDYLTRKRIEVENLRILARGKEKGVSEQILKEMVVIS
jgi:V/A-type H+-transporting ATPase subunit C